MRYILSILFLLMSSSAHSVTDKTGTINKVEIWGGVAKARVCDVNNNCQDFWVNLDSTVGKAVYSTWLSAKVSKATVYIQGYDDRDPSHPYNNSSKFYGMNFY